MSTKLSEDIVPLNDLKVNRGKVVSHAQEIYQPLFDHEQGARGGRWLDHSRIMRKILKSAPLCRES